MKIAVFLKNIAFLAFFTFFSGISDLHSMQSSATFRDQVATTLNTYLATCPESDSQRPAIENASTQWESLDIRIDPSLFEGIFKHMPEVYGIFIRNTKRQNTNDKQTLNNNIAFVAFVRNHWNAVVRTCNILGVDNLTAGKLYFLIQTMNIVGAETTTKALAQYNAHGNKKLTIDSLDGEMLLFLTKCYNYFVATAAQTTPLFDIKNSTDLPTSMDGMKPLPAEATDDEKQARQLALADLIKIVIKSCLDQGVFSVYEDNTISTQVDIAAKILGLEEACTKKLRADKRKKFDPSHRLLESLVTLVPLLLMSTINTMLTTYSGETGAYVLMVLSTCTMLSRMLCGNNKLVKALSFINPMQLGPIMWLVRSAGHKAIDYFVAKKGSKSWVNPLARVVEIGKGAYQVYTISRIFLSITCNILSSIVAAGYRVAGNAYVLAIGMLYNVPLSFSSLAVV